MNRSRIRRQQHRNAVKMLEMIARGGLVLRTADARDRKVSVSVELPKAGGELWYAEVSFSQESLRGEPGP